MPRSSVRLNRAEGQTPTTTTISNSSTEIVGKNDNRKWCLVTNNGLRDVFIAIGKTAEVDKGAVLKRNGGSMLMDASFLSTEVLNGITSAGTSTVLVIEGI